MLALVGVAIALLLARQKRRLVAWHVLLGFGVAGGLLFVALGAMVVTGRTFGGFGLIRLAYFFVIAACAGLITIVCVSRFRSGVSRGAAMLAGVAVGILALCAHVSWIEPYRLRVERVAVPLANHPPRVEPLRVVVIADIQTDSVTAYERGAVQLALAEQPDLVVLPGDFFQGSDADWQSQRSAWRELFKPLRAPGGVYACLGNIDPEHRAAELFAGTEVRLLRNEVVETFVRGRRVAIGGVDWHYDAPAARAARARLATRDADLRILLAHTPDAALDAAAPRVDLVISGHTHGGQMVVPGIGPPLTFARVPRQVAAGGLHTLNGQALYVSRGVGFERGLAPPMRFWCPPELTLLEFGAIE